MTHWIISEVQPRTGCNFFAMPSYILIVRVNECSHLSHTKKHLDMSPGGCIPQWQYHSLCSTQATLAEWNRDGIQPVWANTDLLVAEDCFFEWVSCAVLVSAKIVLSRSSLEFQEIVNNNQFGQHNKSLISDIVLLSLCWPFVLIPWSKVNSICQFAFITIISFFYLVGYRFVFQSRFVEDQLQLPLVEIGNPKGFY